MGLFGNVFCFLFIFTSPRDVSPGGAIRRHLAAGRDRTVGAHGRARAVGMRAIEGRRVCMQQVGEGIGSAYSKFARDQAEIGAPDWDMRESPGSWAVGQLGSWAVGQLGSWAVGMRAIVTRELIGGVRS